MSASFFDDMGGEFEARLKRTTVTSRTSKSDGRELTVSNPLAVIEARFSYRVLDRLYFPAFVAIERRAGDETVYPVYEVVGVRPTHYQLSGVDSSMPTLLRKEYLDTIKESWGKSQETWIDLDAVPTSYIARVDGGTVGFEKGPQVPLPGAQVFLLSKESVEKFLCESGGEVLGKMVGFELPFTASMDNLIRYHCALFAFTGSGKSNLASSLVRKALKSDPSLSVVVFDIAGEYAVNLLDLLDAKSKVFTTEFIDSAEQFVDSQAIPESLEAAVGREKVEKALAQVYARGIERLSLKENQAIDLLWIQQLLQGTVDNGRAGATAAKVGLTSLTMKFYEKRGYRQNTKLSELDAEARSELAAMLGELNSKVNEKSGLRSDLDMIVAMLESGDLEEKGPPTPTPETLAEKLARGTAPRLCLVYLPDPLQARTTVDRFVRTLLWSKKKYGSRQRVLLVLDEAQEYIPDDHIERDYTSQSNRAVEQLLRQGRKYRLHCLMATQRVARLNVNAIQQFHSYFVSTLPRFYDRMVIADAFGLPYEVLERSAQLDTGEWIFVSYKAAKQKNVPVFLSTENNESVLASRLSRAPS